MKKIRHGNKSIKWHEAIQIAAHYYNTFPSASNGHSPCLLHVGRGCSNPLWKKLNPGNTVIRQGDITTSVHELHKLWKAHASEIRKNRSKNNNPKIDRDPPLKIGDRVLIMNYNSHGLDPNSSVIGISGSSILTDRSKSRTQLETSECYPPDT